MHNTNTEVIKSSIRQSYKDGIQPLLFWYFFSAIASFVLFGVLYLIITILAGLTIDGNTYSLRDGNIIEGLGYVALGCFTILPIFGWAGALFYALISFITNTNFRYRGNKFVSTETLPEALDVLINVVRFVLYCFKFLVHRLTQ